MKRSDNPFFTPEQIKLIKEDILKGAPEFEIERFLITCERTGLDPFSRQVYGHLQNKRVKVARDKWEYVKTVVIITSIDGFRAIGERSGEYRGQTIPQWYYTDDEGQARWHDVFITARDRRGNPLKVPDACRVGVIRQGFQEPCYGVANFESFAQYYKPDDNAEYELNTFWKKMPEHMIAKVAEAQAFRKAFPLLACGLFVEEEIKGEDEEEAETPGTTHAVPDGATKVECHPIGTAAKKAAEVAAAPVTPPPEEKPAGEAHASGAAHTKKAAKPAKEPANPEEEDNIDLTPTKTATSKLLESQKSETWEEYVISKLTQPEYNGRKLSTFTLDELTKIVEKWVNKYREKWLRDKNEGKLHEASMITAAYEARKKEEAK